MDFEPVPLTVTDAAVTPPITVRREDAAAGTVVAVAGELDLTTVPRLEALLRRPPEGGRLVLDLRELSFIDSSGVHAVLRLDVRAREDGWAMALAAGPGRALEVLTLCGIADRLTIVDDPADALGDEPDGAATLAETAPAIPASVPALRRAVTEFARAAGAGDATVADVALAVSEAVTNVVLHAYEDRDEPGPVHVEASVVDGRLDLAIRDEGRGMVPRDDSPGMGLGMPLIARSTQIFEVRLAEGGGTDLRLSFPLDA